MPRIYLSTVLDVIEPNSIAKIHIDGMPKEIFIMPSAINTRKFLLDLCLQFGALNVEVYQMQGLKGQYEGLEIWARFV